jgi:hypothetical protein
MNMQWVWMEGDGVWGKLRGELPEQACPSGEGIVE